VKSNRGDDSQHEYFGTLEGMARDSFANLYCQPKGALYHYTSTGTAEKIIASNSIRLTHVKCMNDYAEIKLGLRVFLKLAMLIRDKLSEEKDIAYFVQHIACSVCVFIGDDEDRQSILSWVEKQPDDVSNPIPVDIFISCFCEARDELPMWYMYADHGKGVSVGFHGDKLIEAHQRQFEGWREPFSTTIIYDVRQLKRGIATFLDKVIEFLRKHFSEGGSVEQLNKGEFSDIVMYYISIAILAFKHPKFQHENEWRLFGLVPQGRLTNIGFDQAENKSIRPYVILEYPDLSKKLLREVWLGPASPSDVDVARIFFSQKAGQSVTVRKSEIPFRTVG
jgi:Protein of unknown function (DUF2971)